MLHLSSQFFFRAPTDCVQYFTGLNGNVYSYNHQGGKMLQSQDYNNCFRTEEVHALLILTYSTELSTNGSFSLLVWNNQYIEYICNVYVFLIVVWIRLGKPSKKITTFFVTNVKPPLIPYPRVKKNHLLSFIK